MTLIDEFTRKCLAIRVARRINAIGEARKRPKLEKIKLAGKLGMETGSITTGYAFPKLSNFSTLLYSDALNWPAIWALSRSLCTSLNEAAAETFFEGSHSLHLCYSNMRFQNRGKCDFMRPFFAKFETLNPAAAGAVRFAPMACADHGQARLRLADLL